MKIYNTLTRNKEEFIPIEKGKVRMYVCGPTVYGKPHVGHAKSYVFFDVVYRYLQFLGYKVKYVQNITDVGHLVGDGDEGEDKIAKQAKKENVDPYLRPIYDSFDAIFGAGSVERLLEKGVIEIAPLAYMRGRTLNDAVVILDEAQNTTAMQIKMFLTRLGFNSRMIITGDVTQIDLPNSRQSGLKKAIEIVQGIEEIAVIEMHRNDVVRHPVVQKIIEAYEKEESK